MHYDAECVIPLLCCRVAEVHVCDQDYGRGGWHTQNGESSADGLLVAWLLWPSGPLSSDCHSWGLRDRFLWRSHSSKLTPPTKHCLPRPTSHHAICPDRWKDGGLKPTYIFFHWFLLSFVSLGSPIIFNSTYSFCVSIFSFVHPCHLFPSLPLSLHLIHLSVSRAQTTSAFPVVLLQLCCPLPWRSHSFIWIASTSEGIIR